MRSKNSNAEVWCDGVNVQRLMSAMAQMGLSCEVSQEAVAADLAGNVNRLTQAITAQKVVVNNEVRENPLSDPRIASDLALLVLRMARRLKKAGEGLDAHAAGHRELAERATQYLQRKKLPTGSPLRGDQKCTLDEESAEASDPWAFLTPHLLQEEFRILGDIEDHIAHTRNMVRARNVVQTAPERIALVIGEDCPDDADFSELAEVGWDSCGVNANDVWYRRDDLSLGTTPQTTSLPTTLKEKITAIGDGDFEVGIAKIVGALNK